MTGKSEYNRRYRARHAASGLCLDCPRPVRGGSNRCGYHLWYDNQLKGMFYAKRRALGMCVEHCGRPAEPGFARCALHKRRNSARVTAYWRRKGEGRPPDTATPEGCLLRMVIDSRATGNLGEI